MNKKHWLSVLGMAGLAVIAACRPVALLNATIPNSGYQVIQNQAYGAHNRQRLDIYVPEGVTAHAPVVVFFYGGSWQGGHKEDYRFVGQSLADKGWVTVIADYRVYPEVSFPVFNQDAAAAVRWVREHIAKYKGDSGKLFLAGHSAGAYMAVMLAANAVYLQDVGGSQEWICGVIGIAGPYDFLPMTDKNLIALFGGANNILSQPIHYVDRRLPPMFLAYGSEDADVLPRNSLLLAKRLQKFESPVELHRYDGVGHVGIILSLARGFHYKTPLREQVAKFVSDIETAKCSS